MRRLLLTILLLAPIALNAQESEKGSSGPLFMKDLLGDREFFEPWGVGVDLFTMHQDYSIKNLDFAFNDPNFPPITGIDPSLVGVSNDVQHFDFKVDVWLTPFLNVFGVLGHVDGNTFVDLGSVVLPTLGALPAFRVSYDGTVYGLGVNLVYGTENWFAALNNTWTDTDLSGDFNSSVKTYTAQPRLGLIFGDGWTTWLGGMYLDTEERHNGEFAIPFPGLPPVQFDVELESSDKWNYAVGIGKVFSPKATAYLELGFGDRKHTLLNLAYRF